MTVPWHPRERPIRPEILVLVCAWMAAFAVLAAVVARDRARPVALWAVFGALLGPVAIVLLRLAPPGRCPSCGSRVHGWTWACWWCGDPVAVRTRVPGATPGTTATAVEVVEAGAPGTAAAGTARATGPERGDAVPAGAVDDARGPSRGRSGATEAPARSTRRRASSRTAGPSAPPAPAPVEPPPVPPMPASRVLASAVCLRGTALKAGYRYEIRVAPGTLQFVGPVELTPGTVVLEAPLARVDATSFEGRVIVTDHADSRPRILGAFVSVAGCEPEVLAQAIVDAALVHRRETS